MTKQEMLSLINKYDAAYYEENAPLVSDAEYDRLRNEFIEKYGENDLNYVPSDMNSNFAKRKHDYDMLSLDKIKIHDTDKLKKWFVEFGGHVIIQAKIDGFTLVDYQNGIRVTRGDKSQGDILPLAKKIKMGSAPGYVVRGEAYIDKDTFKKINKERASLGLPLFENARNAAAGIARNLDDAKYYEVKYLAYEIRKKDENIKKHVISYKEDVELLKKFGYDTPDTWEFDDYEDLERFVMNFNKDSVKYDIDGLVMKCVDKNSTDKYGTTAHHPKDSIAIKFDTEKAESEILDVIWSVGRTKITPVVKLKPVRLAGTKVENASVHNCDWIKEKNLKLGSKVLVEKSNEIIPQIVKVIEDEDEHADIEIPQTCPSCGAPTKIKNGQLFCSSKSCIAKTVFHIKYVSTKKCLNIAGLGESIAEKIVKTLNLKTWREIFNLTKEDLLKVEGFADKSADKLVKNISKAKTHLSLDKFISCLGVDGIGEATSKDIADYVKTYDGLVNEVKNNCAGLINVDGIGSVVSSNLSNALADIEKLHEYVIPEEATIREVRTDALTIAVTGAFDKPRSYFQQLIESKGHKFSTSVTKKTNYLLVGEKAGNKLKVAEKNNIQIIYSEQELLAIL